jgi:hypothetical protein
MTAPTITPLPTPPSRQLPDTFADLSDAFVAALPAFGTESNTLGTFINNAAVAAAADAVSTAADVVSTGDDVVSTAADVVLAADEVALATTQAGNAATSASTALGYLNAFQADYIGTYADDAAANASGFTIGAGVFYFKDTGTPATSGLRIYNGSAWSAAVLDTAGALIAANDLSDVASTAAALSNIGGAPLASPTFTGTPAAPTATVGTDTTQVATTAFVLANAPSSSVAALTPAATVDISLASADFFTITLDQNTTFTMSNVDAGVDTFNIEITGFAISNTSYDIANASYDSVSFDLSSQDTSPEGLFFKPDGLKMYMIGKISDDVFQYSLSTAWDVSSASYDSVSYPIAQGQGETQPSAISFKSDGTRMFSIGTTTDTIYQHDLSTAWDLSSASLASGNLIVSDQNTFPTSLFFKPDGTRVYTAGQNSNRVVQWNLTTAWDVSSGDRYNANGYFNISSQETQINSVFLKPDGLKMYIVGNSNNTVFQYSLSTAWDVSSASYDSVTYSFATQGTQATSLFFKPDGRKMYSILASVDKVFQYTTGALNIASLTYPSSFKFPAGTAPTVPADGEVNILEAQTTDGGVTFNVTQLGADFS